MTFSRSDALIYTFPCTDVGFAHTGPSPTVASLAPASVFSGYYLTTRLIGRFTSSTGDFPWLNITGSIYGRRELEPLYKSWLCDMGEFQEISAPGPRGGDELDDEPGRHRACAPDITKGYAVVSSPPMPLSPQTVPWGKYHIRVEAMTQGGKRIFCVEGSFDITS